MIYCCYCGSKLMEQAKFCSNCGKPVPAEESQPTMAPSVTECTLDKQNPVAAVTKEDQLPYIIKFCGRELKFEPCFEEYNNLRRKFLNRGNTMKKEFESYYKANVHDFDTLFDKGLENFLAKSKEFLEFSVSIAHEYGALTVDAEWYLQFSDEAKMFCSAMNYYFSGKR